MGSECPDKRSLSVVVDVLVQLVVGPWWTSHSVVSKIGPSPSRREALLYTSCTRILRDIPRQ